MGEAVLEESISRAITNFGAKHYDDAAAVVWQFTPKKAPAAAATGTTATFDPSALTQTAAPNGHAPMADAHMS